MTTYYVATLSQYVLVDADEAAARIAGQAALAELDGGCRGRVPVVIRTIRPATDDEIELDRWHREAVANDPFDRLADPRRRVARRCWRLAADRETVPGAIGFHWAVNLEA